MWLIYLLTAVFIFSSVQADEKSIPKEDTKNTQKSNLNEGEDHKEEVILKPYANWKEKETSLYRTSPRATKGIKGVNIPYTFWYNNYAWEESPSLNEHAEKSFRYTEGEAYAIIVTDKHQFSLDDLDDIIIKNAKASGFEQAKIVTIEKRNVNGSELLFIHWDALLNGKKIDFLSYVYSSKIGSIFLHTYTASADLHKNYKGMECFLNGITIKKHHKEHTDQSNQ